MWCKKRRRKGDNRNQDDSTKGAKRESGPPGTNPEPSAVSIPQASDVKPGTASSTLGSSVASTTDSRSNFNSGQYSELKQAESFYHDQNYSKIEKQGSSQTSYEPVKMDDTTSCDREHPNSKSSYGRDKVLSVQASTRGNYQTSNVDQSGYGKSYERRNSYSRDTQDNLKVPAGFRDSSVFYEQLSPASDQPDQGFSDNGYGRNYTYRENSNSSAYKLHSGDRYSNDSVYKYKEHYNQGSQEAGFFKYSEHKDDTSKYVTSENRASSPNQRAEAGYGRW